MSVRRRLIYVFALMAALLLLPAVYAASRLDELESLAVSGRRNHAAATLALGRFQAGLTELEQRMRRNVALSTDPAQDTTLGRVGAEAAVDSLRKEIGALADYGFPDATDSLGTALDSLAAVTAHLNDLVAGGETSRASDEFSGLEEQSERTRDVLAWVGDRMGERSQEDFERARAISEGASGATWLALAVAVLLAGGAGLWVTYSLSRPLRRLRDGLAHVAEGAFEAPSDLPYDRRDEIGDLSRSFRWMTQHLAELDRMKAEFAGVATHELKNPIHVIQGYIELLREGVVGDDLDPDQSRVMGAVKDQITLLTRLVDRLLQISRLDAGAYPVQPGPTDPGRMLESVRDTFQVLAARRGVEITVEVADSTPCPVPLDADLVGNEVLGNLMGNALKYTPDEGDIRLAAWGEDGPDGKVLVLEVSDSGPGIPPEKAAYVFQKYYQAGEKDRDIGSGLGLAIARETVEAHGGKIVLEPVEGRGATFRIHLPAAGADTARAPRHRGGASRPAAPPKAVAPGEGGGS